MKLILHSFNVLIAGKLAPLFTDYLFNFVSMVSLDSIVLITSDNKIYRKGVPENPPEFIFVNALDYTQSIFSGKSNVPYAEIMQFASTQTLPS
ncbi:hypothetical protein [Spirosoma litoris]